MPAKTKNDPLRCIKHPYSLTEREKSERERENENKRERDREIVSLLLKPILQIEFKLSNINITLEKKFFLRLHYSLAISYRNKRFVRFLSIHVTSLGTQRMF